MTIPIIVLILYVIGIIVLMVTAPKTKEADSFEEYYTGGKAMVGIVIGLIMLMTGFTGSTWTGWVGFGASYGMMIAYGAVYMCIALGICNYVFGTRAWPLGKHYKLNTYGDLMELRYRSKGAKVVSGVVGFLSCVTFITLEIVTIGYIVNAATAGYVSVSIGTFIGTVFMIIYLLAGGVLNLSRINTFQSVIMLGGILVTFAYILFHVFDGVPEMLGLVEKEMPSALCLPGPAGIGTWPAWFSFTFLCGLGVFFYPVIFFKVFMSNNLKEMRKSSIITNLGGIYVLIFEILGAFAIIAYTIKTGYEFENVEGALFEIMTQSGNMVILSILCVFVLAASMGTIDSCTLGLSGLVSNDIIMGVKRIGKKDGLIGTPEYGTAELKDNTIRNSKIIIVILLLGAFVISVFNLPLLVFVAMFNYQVVCNLCIVAFGGLFWKKATAAGAIASLISSCVLTIILIIVGFSPNGLLPGVIGFALGLVVFIVVSLATYKPDSETAKIYDEMRHIEETVLE